MTMSKYKVKVFCDLDGCVADSSRRLNKFKSPSTHSRHNLAYLNWLNKAQKPGDMLRDEPVLPMRKLLARMDNFVYLTSRDEKYRTITQYWLDLFDFPKRKLIMRPSGDHSSYGKFKERVAKGFEAKGYDIIFIDDDPRSQLVRVCRKNNWLLMRVSGKIKKKLP